jgi:hypothetical protein
MKFTAYTSISIAVICISIVSIGLFGTDGTNTLSVDFDQTNTNNSFTNEQLQYRIKTGSNTDADKSSALDYNDDELLDKLMNDTSFSSKPIDRTTLVNIATVITAAQLDSSTQRLLHKIKRKATDRSTEIHYFDNLIHNMDKSYIITELAKLWKKMNNVETIIHDTKDMDPKHTLHVIEKQLDDDFYFSIYDENGVPTDTVEYRTMIEESRHRLYVTFISYAAAGGYLY